MNKKLTIEFEVFKEEKITILSVVDNETDTVLNMFEDEKAERVYKLLTGECGLE